MNLILKGNINMKMKPLVIGDITVRIPIIQGGMGVGVSRYKLASAVANEGGVGIISTAQIGYDEPGFDKDPINTNLMAVKKHIELAKENADGGVIGVNIMVATKQYEKYVNAACEAGADLIISGAGLPLNLPELVKGYNTKIAPIVSSGKAASVILKYWDVKHNAVPDLIVIEGPKAGGHLGFKLKQLQDPEYNFEDEIELIINIVKIYEEKYNKDIPLVLAGGIMTREDILNTLELGLDGVQIGTKFVATEECDASQEFKDAYINAKKEDISLILSPVGLPGRAISNSFIKQIEGERIAVSKCYSCLEKCNPKTIPYCITEALINSVDGRIDRGLIFSGARVDEVNEMTTVKAVFEELCGALVTNI